MARWHPSRCRVCGITAEEAGELAEVWGIPYGHAARISARGYCWGHGRMRELENIEQLEASSGPFFDHWRQRCRAAFGVLDETRQRA